MGPGSASPPGHDPLGQFDEVPHKAQDSNRRHQNDIEGHDLEMAAVKALDASRMSPTLLSLPKCASPPEGIMKRA